MTAEPDDAPDAPDAPDRAVDGPVVAEVVVIGDGPAGTAIAAALHRRGVDVALVGADRPWAATYTTWIDDVEGLDLLDGAEPWAHRFDRITVRFDRTHVVERPYGVIDNAALRSHLGAGLRRVAGIVTASSDLDAGLVVDATGWPALSSDLTPRMEEPPGWQTAYGVVLARSPEGVLGEPTMMDFSDPGDSIPGRPSVPTFAYSLPVADGWLVEETVLTASPAVDPDALLPLLAARLGVSVDALLERAVSTETVRIPMGVAPPSASSDGPVAFGAAAGMIHPATGYSVAAALRSAGPVADAIHLTLRDSGGDPLDDASIRAAVWSDAARRTRHLHRYGHDVLLRLDRDGVHRFFDTFFDLEVETWSPYMRIDTPPRRLAGLMTSMFAAAPWALRAELVTGDPRRFVRLLRP